MSSLAPVLSPLRFLHTAPWGCETRATVIVTRYRVEDKVELEHSTTHVDRRCACRKHPDPGQETANDGLLARRLCDFFYAGQLSSMEVGEVFHSVKWGLDGDAKECVRRQIAWDPVAKVWVMKPLRSM